MSSSSVSVTVTNSGSSTGSDVPQLYLGFPASAGEPPKVLAGFEKVKDLAPGKSQTVTFGIGDRAKSIFDADRHTFTPVSGEFEVMVGASSADIRLKGTFTN